MWRSFSSAMLFFLVAAALAAGCGPSAKSALDGKIISDIGQKDQLVGPPIACADNCKDFVVNRIILPSSNTSDQLGWDYNGDGKKENLLGSVIAALGQMAASLNLQEIEDNRLNSGTALMLLRLLANDFKKEQSSKGQAWIAASAKCCVNPADKVACANEANATCFSGKHSFYPDAMSPKNMQFVGSIEDSKFHYGPTNLKIELPFGPAGDLELNLIASHLTGNLAADSKSITNGILAGTITQSEMSTELIPAITDLLNVTLNAPQTEQDVKETILILFDTDKNNTISIAEVTESDIIKLILAGDVDVNGDGQKEISIGLGFDAVSATINDQSLLVDAGSPDSKRSQDASIKQDAPLTLDL
jgi:hypothetical protein